MRYVGASTADPLDVIRRQDLERRYDEIGSRSGGILTNGSGFLGDNTNFPGFTFDPAEAVAGAAGSFRFDNDYTTVATAERIPVNSALVYEGRVSVRGNAQAAALGKRFYCGVYCYDIDGFRIDARGSAYVGPCRLTRPWTPDTDTSLFVDANPGWNQTAASRNAVLLHDYVSPSGIAYGIGYSRRRVNGTWPNGTLPTVTNIGGGEWEVSGLTPGSVSSNYGAALDVAATIPAGTIVAQGLTGGFQYSFASNHYLSEEWVSFSGRIGGNNRSGAVTNLNFPHGTASMEMLFLPLFNGASNGAVQWMSGLDLRVVETTVLNEVAPHPAFPEATWFSHADLVPDTNAITWQ